MNPSATPPHPELQALTEANEALLKSKSRLQQDILQLKKEFAAKDQNIAVLLKQADELASQSSLLAEKDQSILELTEHNRRLHAAIEQLQHQVEQLSNENTQLRSVTWFQKLFGKKKI